MKPRSDKIDLTRACVLTLALLPCLGELRAQERPEAPLLFQLPANVRLAGMGNAGVAANDGDALLYNPAMILFGRGAALSLHAYGEHAMSGAFGSVHPAGAFTYSLGAQFLRWRGSSTADSVRSLFDEGDKEALNAVFTAAIARTWRGMRIGASMKYSEVRLGEMADGAVAMDIGIARPMLSGTVAIVAQNLGAGAKFAGTETVLPRRFGVGYGLSVVPFNEYLDLGTQVQVLVERDGFVRAAAGGEVGYVPIEGVSFVARAGLRNPREEHETFYTVGAGLNVDRYSLDYAMEPFGAGNVVHRLGVRVR